MKLNGAEIEDTFAEAFSSFYSRILITADTEKLARTAAIEMSGYGTSMIGCSSEAGIEKEVRAEDTPDGRPGCVVQVWTSKKKMKDELLNRIGQCVLTAPTAAVWDYSDSKDRLDIGYKMRYFGDGYEEVKTVHGRECVSIPVMMGEFIIEKELGFGKGVAGGNFIIFADSRRSAILSGEAGVEAINSIDGVITPFPGGVCGAGSKVGSVKYKFMHATTNELYCPTLAGKVKGTKIGAGVKAVLEIVIDGISTEAVKDAMKAGIKAATGTEGVRKISAGNYGGNLGDVKIRLHDLF